MGRELFEKWLRENKEQEASSSSSRVSNCQRIENAYGDLDNHYVEDRLNSVLNDFNTSNHKIKIEGDYSTGTSTLKQALNLYIEYKDSNIINNIINAEDINPDSHDGSYELVRETAESLSKIDKEILDIKDLNLLYGMAIGTWKLNNLAKRDRIYNSNLSDYEKDRLDKVLLKIENNAKSRKYLNREDNKDSVGMFGTGFLVFEGKATKEDANKFLNLCISIKDLEDDDEILNLSESTFKGGIAGLQAASASFVLHCLKPMVFPIINGKVIKRIVILEREGLILDKPSLLTTYVDNTRRIREFRNTRCNFKNYRVLDIELLQLIEKEDKLNDFLQIQESDLSKYKIKLNTKNLEGIEPIDVIINDEQARHRWMGWKYKNNQLSRDYVIGLAREYKLGQEFWRFIGVFKIVERYENITDAVGYKLEELDEYNEYKNKLVLKYKNTSQNLIINAETSIDQFTIVKADPLEEIKIGQERLEAIVDAFKKVGGEGRLKDIFDIIKNDSRFKIHRFASDSSAEGSIRLIIQEHSSDSGVYKKSNEDLFYSVDGIGRGLWGLRKREVETIDVDFTLPLDITSLFFEEPDILEKQISTAMKSGKSIILIGPPGTGKSKLAKCVATSYKVDSKMVTAMSDWSSYDTIGGYKPNKDGSLYFEEGIFLNCLKDKLGKNMNRWLIIDEINRADIDKAFGPFLSALSGDDIELGLKDTDNRNVKLLLGKNLEKNVTIGNNEYVIPKDWRIIGTMNTFDKTSLYEMSYAFMRRFAFIPVAIPRTIDIDVVKELFRLWDINSSDKDKEYIAELWNLINKYRKVGPAIIEDIAKFITLGGDYTSSIIVYILPQLEGIFDDRIISFVEELKKLEFINDMERLKDSVEDFFNMKLSGV